MELFKVTHPYRYHFTSDGGPFVLTFNLSKQKVVLNTAIDGGSEEQSLTPVGMDSFTFTMARGELKGTITVVHGEVTGLTVNGKRVVR